MRRAQSPPSRSIPRPRGTTGRWTEAGEAAAPQVAIAAPFRRDAEFIEEALRGSLEGDAGFRFVKDPDDLAELEHDRHVFILAQEALTPRFIDRFAEWLGQRPDWVQVPVLLLLDEGLSAGRTVEDIKGRLHGADLTFLYRPCYVATFRSSVRNAITLLRQGQSVDRLLRLERQLRSEIDHRMKNQLATVLALYQLTRRQSEDFAEFDRLFSQRIKALNDVHVLLRRAPEKAITFRDLCETVLAPYGAGGEGNVGLAGPGFEVSREAALTLSLLLNELATNAAKYGAFSAEGGKVALTTLREAESWGFTWEETGGPAVETPEDTSYGTAFIKNAAAMLEGSALFDYSPTGLRARILFSPERAASR